MAKDEVHIYNGILLNYKTEQNNVICSIMAGPRDCQSEDSQRKTCVTQYHLYAESKKKKKTQMNVFTKQTDSD